MTTEKLAITIYTDGSTSPGNPGPSGYGFYGTDSENRTYSGYGIVGSQKTNNESELTAAIKALDLLITRYNKQVFSLLIYSDSKYLVDNLKLVSKWERNNWLTSTGTPVANVECWKRLKLLQDQYKLLGCSLRFQWVKGHNGTQGNEMADKLANQGRLLVVQQEAGNPVPESDVVIVETVVEKEVIPVETVIKPEKAVKAKVTPVEQKLTPLLTGKKWFFYTQSPHQIPDGRYFYTTSTYKEAKQRDQHDEKAKNQGIARRNPDTHYSILVTHEQINELEHVRDQFNKNFNQMVSPVIVNLATLTKPTYWQLAQEQQLSEMGFNGTLATLPDSVPVGAVIFPPKLIFKLEDIYKYGFQILDHYERKSDHITIIDITDQLLSVEKTKRILHPEFTNGAKTIEIFVDPEPLLVSDQEKELLRAMDKVTLNLGIDLPTRNSFNALIKDKELPIKVSLIVFELSACSFRLATIVDCGTSIGIYYNPDANYRILSIPL